MRDKFFELQKAYKLRKKEILRRLSDFARFRQAPEADIFEELCFCLLTPGAKAENCARIVAELKERGLLLRGSEKDLHPHLKKARFYAQKAGRLVGARKILFKGKVFGAAPYEVRDWLVRHVSGLGYKEASHFLRNVGLGEDLAILDRHILRRLKSCGVLKELPKTLTARRYLAIEEMMRRFSREIKIPLSHLDLLFFSEATGKPIASCK